MKSKMLMRSSQWKKKFVRRMPLIILRRFNPQLADVLRTQ
jgi:hypothetical protein